MAEANTEQEKKIYQPEEIHEMFNSGFLSKLQEFAKRTKKEMFADDDIACFQCRLILEFTDLDTPLTYELIKEKVNLQMQPMLQKDVDKAKAEAKEAEAIKAKEKDSKDTGDVVA